MPEWIKKLQESHIIVAAVGLLLVAWFSYNTAISISKNYELVQKIDQLNDEIAVLQLKNENLVFQIDYYQSDAYLDMQARDKLGQVTSGERVLVLPDDRYDALSLQPEDPKLSEEKSNFQQWMDFLFGS